MMKRHNRIVDEPQSMRAARQSKDRARGRGGRARKVAVSSARVPPLVAQLATRATPSRATSRAVRRAARVMKEAVRRRLNDFRARAGSLAAKIAAAWTAGRRTDESLVEMEALSDDELRDV